MEISSLWNGSMRSPSLAGGAQRIYRRNAAACYGRLLDRDPRRRRVATGTRLQHWRGSRKVDDGSRGADAIPDECLRMWIAVVRELDRSAELSVQTRHAHRS